MFTRAYPLIHRNRKRTGRKPRPTTPTPVALVLIAATYQEATWVRLTFDRPIDIAGLVGSAIVVDDANLSATRWQGTAAATMVTAVTVQIELTEFDPLVGGSGILLDATGGSGIVAVDDGGAWGGVSDVELPFP